MALKHMLTNRDISSGSATQQIPREHQQQIHQTRNPGYFICLAAQAFCEASGLKVSRAHSAIRLMDQAAIGTNRLIGMMLDDGRFLQQPSQKEWHKSWSCEVNDFRPADQSPKTNQVWRADDAKWQPAIIKIARRSLRDER
jgi:hypothetical protein